MSGSRDYVINKAQNQKNVNLSKITFRTIILTMLTGGAIVFFKTKKSYGFALMLAGAVAVAIASAAGLVKNVFTSTLKNMEGWGLYQAQTLISSINHHGFLYYFALIIYIYGLFSAIISFRENNEIPLMGLIIFLVYFFLMFILISTNVTNKYNPINISVRLANGIVDEVLNLYGGVNAAKYDNFKIMQQQINNEMVVHDVSVGGFLPQPVSEKIADFVKQCEPGKKTVGAIEIAIPYFDKWLQNYTYYDKKTGKPVSCAVVRNELEQEIGKYVDAYLRKVATIRKVNYNNVRKTALEEAREFVNSQIKPAIKGAIPSAWGSPDPYSDLSPSGSTNWTDLGLTDKDYLALYAFDTNDLSSQVFNALFDQSVGRGGHGISGIFHSILGGLKQFAGGFIIAILDIINSILVPYVIYGFYMTNAIFFAFLEAFFPIVWILNMGRVVNFKAIMKYIFTMIWVKSWVIPAVFLTQIYNFYMRKSYPSMASLIYVFLMFSIPSMMAIILLEGNAVLSKLDFGITPKSTMPIISGVSGSGVAKVATKVASETEGAVSQSVSSVGKATSGTGNAVSGIGGGGGYPPIST